MTPDERCDYLSSLDAELLKGGIILSEWCAFIVRDADTAFVSGAYIACIVLSVSGIETYLRSEYASGSRERLASLVDNSPIKPELKQDIHGLRKYRNTWVHVDDPWNDGDLLDKREAVDVTLEHMALAAIRILRQTVYENPWI